jgi:hypothetical protein
MRASTNDHPGASMAAEHYDVVVNTGDLNVRHLTRTLNEAYEKGWKLAHIFEQHRNTVMVLERRD